MAVLVVRSGTPLSLIEESFGSTKINIPKAPALGLLLERPVFESYNTRLNEKRMQKAHPRLEFDSFQVWKCEQKMCVFVIWGGGGAVAIGETHNTNHIFVIIIIIWKIIGYRWWIQKEMGVF